ncbi:MAG: DUF3268 family zinc-finger domain-containing protein [Aristaeellaceae bacterium]
MRKVYCDYCGSRAQYVDSKVIYGRSYGMIYLCKPCDAYVGVHRGTDVPLGRLANAELRKWKCAAHDAFDPIWKNKRMTRNAAYLWLSDQLGIPSKQTHIGMFDVPTCKKVVQICNQWRQEICALTK